jgi:hypothetical protein
MRKVKKSEINGIPKTLHLKETKLFQIGNLNTLMRIQTVLKILLSIGG